MTDVYIVFNHDYSAITGAYYDIDDAYSLVFNEVKEVLEDNEALEDWAKAVKEHNYDKMDSILEEMDSHFVVFGVEVK